VSLKVFVGSSREGTKHEAFLKLCGWIEAEGHHVVRWDEPGLFPLGQYTLETLLQLAPTVDAAVLIFSPDDPTWYRGSGHQAARDNVILEYGLFSGVLGRHKAIVFEAGATRVATDLDGLTILKYRANQWAAMEREFRSWLESLAQDEVNKIDVRWKPPEESPESPFQAHGKQRLFEVGTKLIKSAESRVALVAKTPVVLMGPRPYGNPTRYFSWERDQYHLYRELARAASERVGSSLLCLANTSAVLEDTKREGEALISAVCENFDYLRELEDQGGDFALRWHNGLTTLNFLVADNDFLIWLKDGTGESVWITASNEMVSNALMSHAEDVSKKASRFESRADLEAALRGNAQNASPVEAI